MKKIVYPVKSQLFSRPFINKSCCWESTSACVTRHQAYKRCSACGRWLSVVTISIPKAKIFSFPLLHIQYFRTEENWIGNISTCFVLWPTGDCCLSEWVLPRFFGVSWGSKRFTASDPFLGLAGLRCPSLLLLASSVQIRNRTHRDMKVWLT